MNVKFKAISVRQLSDNRVYLWNMWTGNILFWFAVKTCRCILSCMHFYSLTPSGWAIVMETFLRSCVYYPPFFQDFLIIKGGKYTTVGGKYTTVGGKYTTVGGKYTTVEIFHNARIRLQMIISCTDNMLWPGGHYEEVSDSGVTWFGICGAARSSDQGA